MKVTVSKVIIMMVGCLCFAEGAGAQQVRRVDYQRGVYYEDRGRHGTLPRRVRIQATTQRDHQLAHRLIEDLHARRAIDPYGPPIDVFIKYGRVSLQGAAENPGEHTRILDAAERLRGEGAKEVRDELKVVGRPPPPPYRY
jgi:osmotically-inducible protein OsmY